MPHSLNSFQKSQRVRIAKQLLEILKRASSNNWSQVVTGDESWLKYSNPPSGQWLAPGARAPETPRLTVASKKVMIVVFWNPHGLQQISAVSQGSSLKAQEFCDTVLQQIADSPASGEARLNGKHLLVHFDNAPIHTAEIVKEKMSELSLTLLPHPAYSPDLAPSDFFLFGYLKNRAKGIDFACEDDVIEWVRDEFQRIPKGTLHRVFEEWIYRLERCIQVNGEYIE